LFERLKGIKDDQDRGRVRLCFGSRKLFLAQFALKANGYEANGYKDHSDWKADWLQSRSSQFFVLGSQDEIAGKYLLIPGVKFAYGHDAILAALGSNARVKASTATQKKIVKRTGTALS
jgi:hypothetical protein